MRVLVINGPNLNMLGKREKDIYGATTLAEITQKLKAVAEGLGVGIDFFTSNHEGDIVEKIQQAAAYDGILINAAAYTHTSIAIRDALLAVGVPFIEVHLSNIYRREPFRHRSFLSDIAVGIVSGFGAFSYILALQGLVEYLKEKRT